MADRFRYHVRVMGPLTRETCELTVVSGPGHRPIDPEELCGHSTMRVPIELVPVDLRFPNSSAWIGYGEQHSVLLFRHADDAEPAGRWPTDSVDNERMIDQSPPRPWWKFWQTEDGD